MTFSAGTRLGEYEILALIGSGGMGEVYRARDIRLNRDVAIKTLPSLFAADRERLARFEREAQALASLNHPNIAQIYRVEDRALVMEFVDGVDLAARLTRGPVPIDEAIGIVKQIATALEAAHERGIIHRDLKPANIKIAPDDTVNVLDFGLAKAIQASAESAPISATLPTITRPAMTNLGIIVGTAAYMAPEQAKGKPVDQRSDIWALGVVLFEMLTARRPYEGETVTDTIAKVITQPPDWTALPPHTPAVLRRILRRCLEKDPRMRFQAAGDIRLEIDDYLASPDERDAGPRSSARSIPQRWPWAVAGLLVAALALALSRPWSASTPAALPMRLDIRVADSEQLIFDDARDSALAVISPDGQSLVYRGTRDGIRRLYVRSLNSGQSRLLAGTEGALAHFFSPDGSWVAFFASGMLNKVALTGGAPVQICSAPAGKGGAWSDDDTIVFTPNTETGLFRVSSAGGSPVQVTKPAAGERTHRWPTFLPGGKAVVFMRQNTDAAYDDGLIEAVRLDTGERKVLVRGGTFPRYLASGHLAYMREGTLFVVSMNPDRLELRGDTVPVLAEILSSGGVGNASGDGAGQISFSTNGTAVYIPGSWSGPGAALEIVDRTGKTIYTYPKRHDFGSPRFSPDGMRIAVVMRDANGGHVYVVDPARGTANRVTFDGTDNGAPVWTPDGRRLAYSSDRASSTGNIFLTRSDGSGEPERLTSAPHVQVPSSFSSDGRLLAGMEAVTATSMRLLVTATSLQLFVLSTADGLVRPLMGRGSIEFLPVFSPDNRWIAYTSNESGTPEIYVRPYSGPGSKWRISTASGWMPRWTRGGREIVYLDVRAPTRLMAVDISVDGDELKPGAPTVLFEASIARLQAATLYDASADGTRFVILKTSANVPLQWFTHVTVALNFLDEVRRATAAKRLAFLVPRPDDLHFEPYGSLCA